MDMHEKARENRLRRKLDRMGYRLMKHRARDPHALDYGRYYVVDPDLNAIIYGGGNQYAYIDDIEAWTQGDGAEMVRERRAVYRASARNPGE